MDTRGTAVGKGFTLVELIATIAIVALLALTLGVFVPQVINWARQTSDKQTLAVLNDALNRYKTQGGSVAGLTAGAPIRNVIARLQSPVNWAGMTHQFLQSGKTYAGRSIDAKGAGTDYRFTRYDSYTAETGGTSPSGGSPYVAAVLADAPLAFWRLNEPSGTVATDSSGSGRNAVYVGTLTYGLPGPTLDNGAAAVSSSSSANYVEFGSYASPVLAPFTSLQPMSMEAWIYTTTTGFGIICCKSDSTIQITSSSGFGSRNLMATFGFSTTNAVATTASLLDKLSAANVWVHVVATLDSSGVPRIYVNGVEGGGLPYHGQTTGVGTRVDSDSNHTVRILRDRHSGAAPGGLRVANVAFYNTCLSASQVLAHFNAAD